MAQRDYVSRGRTLNRRKKSNRNKKSSLFSKTMPILALAVLILFIGLLYTVSHNTPHKNNQSTTPVQEEQHDNHLPPKPAERWSYIKELENRPVSVADPKPPSLNDTVNAQTPLTTEQRQLLQQIQTDMTKKPTKLHEYHTSSTEKTTSLPAPIPTHTEHQQKSDQWFIQCGSFHQMQKAESARAKLALAGFESNINQKEGLFRVLIGPYASKTHINHLLQQLAGHTETGCIALSTRG